MRSLYLLILLFSLVVLQAQPTVQWCIEQEEGVRAIEFIDTWEDSDSLLVITRKEPDLYENFKLYSYTSDGLFLDSLSLESGSSTSLVSAKLIPQGLLLLTTSYSASDLHFFDRNLEWVRSKPILDTLNNPVDVNSLIVDDKIYTVGTGWFSGLSINAYDFKGSNVFKNIAPLGDPGETVLKGDTIFIATESGYLQPAKFVIGLYSKTGAQIDFWSYDIPGQSLRIENIQANSSHLFVDFTYHQIVGDVQHLWSGKIAMDSIIEEFHDIFEVFPSESLRYVDAQIFEGTNYMLIAQGNVGNKKLKLVRFKDGMDSISLQVNELSNLSRLSINEYGHIRVKAYVPGKSVHFWLLDTALNDLLFKFDPEPLLGKVLPPRTQITSLGHDLLFVGGDQFLSDGNMILGRLNLYQPNGILEWNSQSPHYKVYPNPYKSESIINIEGTAFCELPIKSVLIYSLEGVLIGHADVLSNKGCTLQIDISEYNSRSSFLIVSSFVSKLANSPFAIPLLKF